MTKEIAVKETTALSTNVQFEDYEISTNEIIIPKINLMQPISEMVTEGKAKYGDFVNSLTNEVIGNSDEGIEFMPISFKRFFIINKKNQSGKFEFDRYEPIVTSADERLPYLDVEGVTPIERKKVLEFCVVCPKYPELPFVIQFKGMSTRAGQSLYTLSYVVAKAAKKMPFEKVFTLFAKKTKNDKGNFAVMESSVKRNPTPEELQMAALWYGTIKVSKVTSEVEEKEVQTNLDF